MLSESEARAKRERSESDTFKNPLESENFSSLRVAFRFKRKSLANLHPWRQIFNISHQKSLRSVSRQEGVTISRQIFIQIRHINFAQNQKAKAKRSEKFFSKK